MEKKYYSIELGIANLNAIKAEKASVVKDLNHYKANVEKNPRYYNLCKGKINSIVEMVEELTKEAKACRRYIRKAKATNA